MVAGIAENETVVVADAEAGTRIDRVLAARTSLSRTRLKALILDGAVTIGGRTIVDPGYRVNAGESIVVAVPEPEAAEPEGENIPLNVVFEDDQIVVIDADDAPVVLDRIDVGDYRMSIAFSGDGATAYVTTSVGINVITTATGEVTGTNYSAGGVTVTNANAPASTNSSATAGVAYWTPSASITYTTVTLTTAFNAVLIYNSSKSNKAVSVHTFGDQTITAGTFTLTMPTNDTTNALLRLATT